MSHANAIPGLYARHAEAFDRIRGKNGFERPWLDRLVAPLPEHAHVLDIGCGSGEPIAADLIGRGFFVTGLDVSEPLIRLCRERFPGHDWHVGDMRDLSLGRTFEAIVAWHSFFHLTPEAQRTMFPRFASHAARGGVLMFTSGPSAGVAIGEFEGEPLYHASLDPAEYRFLLAESGFVILQHVVEDPACGGATVWLAQKT
ncbi:class I SAM-dependent DNA methyltransferase [Rhizobium sp. 'Codium 1']|uniref:class I SAM-dependent DNA methyltransferase n=1 Tax=Rhizobium sp. 'Codium 1' TaxID=2940484 RepID=UPI001E51498C|nr:class I SAM-dependent methyltransferase [Rhizobium sp. 'Codium 1']MCC8931220.1 class I SAM-dependent methyltransferase [Rhizobium sp. 'Codium 1']